MAAQVAAVVLTPTARGQAVGCELGAGVEAEPAEPQETGAEHDERQVVRAHGLLAEAEALAEDEASAGRRHRR